MMNCPPAPSIKYGPAPCPRCGATDEDQAGDVCKPGRDETGEATCPGEFGPDGNSIQPTPESLRELDRWMDEHCECGDRCNSVVDVGDPLHQILADALRQHG